LAWLLFRQMEMVSFWPLRAAIGVLMGKNRGNQECMVGVWTAGSIL